MITQTDTWDTISVENDMLRALKLALSLTTGRYNRRKVLSVPGYEGKLDPAAVKQVRAAIKRAEAAGYRVPSR